MSSTMTRSEVAEHAGVSSETVRYYEKRGLIPHPPRSDGGFRLYDESFVRRIRFVKRAQELGFTLNKIDGLLALRVDEDAGCGAVKARAEAKLADVEEKICDLRRIQSALRTLSDACAGGPGPTSECPILEAMQDEEALGDAFS